MSKFNDMDENALERVLKNALNAGTKDMVKGLEEQKEKLWEDYVKETKNVREGLVEVLETAKNDFDVITEDGEGVDVVGEFKALLTDTFQFGCEIGSFDGGLAMNSTWVEAAPKIVIALMKGDEDGFKDLFHKGEDNKDEDDSKDKDKPDVDSNDEDAGGEAFEMMSGAMNRLKKELTDKFGKSAAGTFMTAYILAAAREITLKDERAKKAFEKAKDVDFS